MVKFTTGKPQIGEHEITRAMDVLRSGQLTQGPVVKDFEDRLAAHLKVNHVVASSSGTSALHLALLALGIGPGDEVLIPDLTFIATANAVAYTGATPVLVDIDPETWNIDLEEAQQHLSPRTRAILVVHLYGVPCNMDAVNRFAAESELFVVEDAAEAFGGSWNDIPCGTWGDVGTFSFYGNKILTCGEGGALVTNDENIAERARFLRGQAQDPTRRYFHLEVGFNYRMTELQASIGLGQMDHLPEMLKQRQRVCELYLARMRRYGYSSMSAAPRGFAPWLFTMQVMCSSRDALAENLTADGIETRPVFVPLHRMPMYERPDDEFQMASLISDTGLSLPTYAELSLDEASEVCDAVVRSTESLCSRL